MASAKVNVKCHRSGKTVYAADPYVEIDVRIAGAKEKWTFLKQNFTCKATGTQLNLKNYEVYDDGSGADVYFKDTGYKRGKQPDAGALAVPDVITQRVTTVPDSNMRTSDRMLNVAGKQVHKGTKGADAGSSYGIGGVDVERVKAVPDSNMRTSDRTFQITSNAAARGAASAATVGSAYDHEAVVVKTVVTTDKPPTTVNNINLMEMRRNGGGAVYTGTEDPGGLAE